MTAPAQVAKTFKATPLTWWFSRSAISVRRLARSLPKGDGCLLDCSAHCGRRWTYLAALQQPHLLAHFAAPIAPVSFSWKETGARTAAASHAVQGIAATLLVTIGLTNSIRHHPQRHRHRCRSPWKGCTWLTVRHAPGVHVFAFSHPGSPGVELVCRHSLHPPAFSDASKEARFMGSCPRSRP